MDMNMEKSEFIYEEERIWPKGEHGKMLAHIDFPKIGENTVNIAHTVVSEDLRGLGIADRLVRKAAGYFREKGIKAELSCSYAIAWFEKHPEEGDVLKRR